MSTHNISFFKIEKKKNLNYPKSVAMGFFSRGLKNEFDTAVVNEPSVFEPLKVYSNKRRNKLPLQQIKIKDRSNFGMALFLK